MLRKRPPRKPLRPVHYLMLVVLSESDMHAYGLKKEVRARTEGRVDLGPGSLHRAIRTLEDAGLIEESDHRPTVGMDDPRRRYYRISQRGRSVLSEETLWLSGVVEQALRNLGYKGNG